MMRFGHNLKPLNAEIKCIGTAYGDHAKTTKKIRGEIIRNLSILKFKNSKLS